MNRVLYVVLASTLLLSAGVVGVENKELAQALQQQDTSPQKDPEEGGVKEEKEQVVSVSPVQLRLYNLHCGLRDRIGTFRQNLSQNLCDRAQRWAENMAARHSMYHSGDWCENVACGYQTPEIAMSVWEGSGGHYANLANNEDSVGFGACQDENGTWYWCSLHQSQGAQVQQADGVVCENGVCTIASGSCADGNCGTTSAVLRGRIVERFQGRPRLLVGSGVFTGRFCFRCR